MGVVIFSRRQQGDFKTFLSDNRDNSEIVSLLREGEITACKMIPSGTNSVFLLLLRRDKEIIRAIYKPRRGEAPLYDFPDGTLYLREAAAYLVSQALGWHFIPPTEIREGPYGVGMVQQFITARPSASYSYLVRKHSFEFRQIAVFDWLVNNADRKVGHCLEGEDGRIWGIDHGLTFNIVPKLRTVIWDFSGEAVPKDIVADIYKLKKQLDNKTSLFQSLSRLLTANEISALEKRLRIILRRPVFPVWSGAYRNIPWPPY
jgi:uncharacterized repeat protein (TIGR03843 family)